ncbi:MAG: response regulator [Chloroflexi bacterium]|nr:response regulator [Chloroflexota bacterium]
MARILVAEDERDIRELIGHSLRFAGLDVVLVATGAEAIEKAPIERPDLIILDVRMPKMTGYEACRILKDNPVTRDIPVVFLSAKGQEREIEQGLESGAEQYILKPFAPNELAEEIKAILNRVQSRDR